MRRPRTLGVALSLYLILSSVAVASAATVTLGPTLQPGTTSGVHFTCGAGGGCTFGQAAPKYLSPVTGVIVRWRVIDSTGPMTLRVLNGQTGGAVGATENVASKALQEFPASLPIKAGESIGLDLPETGTSLAYLNQAETAIDYWNPALGDGEFRAPNSANTGFQLLFNADVQPPPGISALTPASGSIQAPNSVVISGHDFTNASAVGFGSNPALSYTVDSDTQITATAPVSAALAKVPIRVTTIAGTAVSPTDFAYTGCKVPKLKGKKLKAGKKKIKTANCKLGKVKKRKGAKKQAGKVLKQTPKPGTVLPVGAKVRVVVGKP